MNDTDLYASMPDDIKPVQFQESELTTQAKQLAQEQLTGAIPDDVARMVEQRSAESAAMRGLGIGKSAGALTLRDLGLTSVDMQSKGAASAALYAESDLKRQGMEEELRQKALTQSGTWQLQTKELNQKWASALKAAEISQAEVAQSMLGLQVASRNYLATLENDLIKYNAGKAIPDFQANLEKLGGTADQPGYFEQMEQGAQYWINKMQGV